MKGISLLARNNSSQPRPQESINKKNLFNLNLFSNPEEKKLNDEHKSSLEAKLAKYKKKYSEKREKCSVEQEKAIEVDKDINRISNEISKLKVDLSESKNRNKILTAAIEKNRKRLSELQKDCERENSMNPEHSKDVLDLRPSYSSLQFDNLQEKLNTKNKRIEDLEINLIKENEHTQMLQQEINSLKSQLEA